MAVGSQEILGIIGSGLGLRFGRPLFLFVAGFLVGFLARFLSGGQLFFGTGFFEFGPFLGFLAGLDFSFGFDFFLRLRGGRRFGFRLLERSLFFQHGGDCWRRNLFLGPTGAL